MVTSEPPGQVLPTVRRIPVEVYAHIFRKISDTTVLRDLCTVSHTFRNEAERVLYRTVILEQKYYRIFSWFKVVAQTPRLANLVYSLTIPTDCGYREEPSACEIVELRTLGKQAFSSLSSLGELYLYVGLGTVGTTYLVPQMLLGHRFNLRVFEDVDPDVYSPINCMLFLSEQRELRHWGANIDPDIQSLGDDLVPSLTSASIRFPMLKLLAPRPIRALEIHDCSSLLSLSTGLKAFRRTLSSLVLRFDRGMVGIQPTVTLGVLSEVVPDLKFLCLEVSDLDSQYPADIDFLIALEGFPHLSHLMLTYRWIFSRKPRYCGDEESMANAYMKASASLSRIAFKVPGERRGTFACFARVGTQPDAKGDGVAVFEGMDIMTSDSWKAF